MSANTTGPVVNPHQVVGAGLASTGAAFVTSRFGVAGTLLGAALTAMIITGGSAILRAYFESVSGRVRQVPGKLRSRREQQKVGGFGSEDTMPGRSDLKDNFAGRMRAALDWFSHLPTLRRRSILMKGLLAAAVAFVICMGVVWGAEKVIGNSLSCGLWAECPYGAVPGIHPAGYDGTGAGSTISGGVVDTGGTGRPGLVDRVRQHSFGGAGQPVFKNPVGAPSSASPNSRAVPDRAAPASASPAAGQNAAPASASPAAGQNAVPASASPAAGQ